MRREILVATLILAIPLAAAVGVETYPTDPTPIRPGAALEGATCTIGWLIETDTALYATTAGHCTETTNALSVAGYPVTLAYRPADHDDQQQDIALLRIYHTDFANASMLGLVGVRGVASGVQAAEPVALYGQSPGFPTHLRTGNFTQYLHNSAHTNMPIATGDSGAPVLVQNGRLALAVNTRIHPVATEGSQAGIRMDWILSHLQANGYPDARLKLSS